MTMRYRTGLVLVGATATLCLLPRATHTSPGAAGYLWATLVLAAGVGFSIGWSRRDRLGGPAARTVLLVVAPFALVLGWGVVTLLWSATPSGTLALISLLLAGLSLALPALVVIALPTGDLAPVLRLVAAAAVTGTAVSWVRAGMPPGERLASPLGPASAVHLPLTLCLAVLLAAALGSHSWHRGAWGTLAALAGLLTLWADSRAGTAALVVIAWVLVVKLARGTRAALIGCGAALATSALLVAYLRWERPGASLTDGARWHNHVQGLQAWVDGGWPILLGRGSGSVWPWLATELGAAPSSRGGFVIPSRWGELLYHPHSTLLGVLVELGPAALALTVLTLATILLSAARLVRDPDPSRWLPAAALLATAPGLLLETYLFRGFPAAVVWWSVALVVVRWADLNRR